MIKPVKWNTHLEIFSEKAIQDIHAASLQILEQTGLILPLNEAKQQQALDLGLDIDRETHLTRFPPEVVESALKNAPPSYTLYARNPENDVLIDGNHGYLGLDGSGTKILDLETGELRNSTKGDLQSAARIADALPEISFLWPAISAQDAPPKVQPLHELEALFTHSSKHVQAMTAVNALNAKGTVEIAAKVAGGRDKLRERPIISNFQCSVSPLMYDKASLEAAFIFAEAGIPVGFVCMPVGCGTAPATVAGNAALVNAEALAGIVLLQLFYPGTPTFYGSSATMMELRSGGVTCGGPEDLFLQAAACQLAHFYGVPASIGTFATGSKASDWFAGVDNTASGAISLFTNSDMMCGAGLLYGARIFSYEQLLMDCETYDMLRRVTQGVEVNEDTLALETIHDVGPQNHFLSTKHTKKHMREIWQPKIMDRRTSWEEWKFKGQPTPKEQAREIARQILSEHEPEPLACAEDIRKIIAEYEKM